MIQRCDPNTALIPWLVRRIEQLACQVQRLELTIGGIGYLVPYVVDAPGGPVSGQSSFTTTIALQSNQAVWVQLNGEGTLIQGNAYSLSGNPITINLLGGRLFNTGEVYTFFIYNAY
jgi:hypothetical protein